MKVLITGAGGQLGTELALTCTAAGDDVIAADRSLLDVSSRDQVLGVITTLQPDVVIHTATWTAVDACEGDPERAYRNNALSCRHVAEACRIAGSHVVGISTDYVFDGTKDGAYTEWDQPNPQSVYARSKLGGEQELISGSPGAAVVRTAGVFGAHGHNIVKTILKLAAEEGRGLRFVDDQIGCPTFTGDLAPLVRRLAAARVPGTFHATNARALSWCEFAREVLVAAGEDPERVQPISTAELARPAPRPANSVLDGVALRGAGFEPLPDFDIALGHLVKELLDA